MTGRRREEVVMAQDARSAQSASTQEHSLRELGIPPALAVAPDRINVVCDPVVAERVGSLLAEALKGHGADVVVSWDGAEDAVLAHIVARDLGVRTAQVFESEGILRLTDPVMKGARALLLADTFRSANSLVGPIGLVHNVGATTVAVGSILSTVHLDAVRAGGIPVVALVHGRDEGTQDVKDAQE